MAEIKNTFIKSKMNKDLDDRLVPTGEYRDALNISISRSEGDDVGALENVLGNDYIFQGQNSHTCIGYFSDSNTQVIYYFVTNYIDSSIDKISNFAPLDSECSIRAYNFKNNQNTVLVEGPFLNFSANKPITGVNVVEDLLFWTDDRNQPRKINIDSAFEFPARQATSGSGQGAVGINPYYTTEDQISVAKYYPWKPISLMNINEVATGVTPTASTMSNPSQQRIPLDQPTATLPPNISAITTYNNPDYDVNFAGDPDYLSDKFIRLSYRFKFDNNEYSLIAPFTQPCFIPKQNGYFLYEGTDPTKGDQQKTYRSTIVSFFENNVTQMLANIELETTTPDIDLKIKEVDILYKESDGLSIKVIESVPINQVLASMQANAAAGGNPRVFTYKYISTKPYKTLPDDQLPRVYDQVPVRALGQEVSGNRVIYGNFTTKGSSLNKIDYSVLFGDKTPLLSVSQKEYPNHTLKQNRNYQVGFVLADRFGRQSSVILSSNDAAVISGGVAYGGSTIYVPYKNGGTSIIDWPGYALRTLVNSLIPTKSQAGISGYPGIYKDSNASVDYFLLNTLGSGYSTGTNIATTGGTGTGLTVDILAVYGGKVGSIIINNPGSGYTNGDQITVTGGNVNCTLTVSVDPANPMGWYTYKIVIRQTEQDYYNVYLPGILNGYPRTYIDSEVTPPAVNIAFERGETANIVLYNDNINKIPRDLNEIGPDQKQYRSAVRLFGRVSPINYSTPTPNVINYNKQYYPSTVGDSVTSISTLADTNYNGTTLGDITQGDNINIPANSTFSVSKYSLEYPEFYQSNTNPLIARISTEKQIGKNNTLPATGYKNTLAVYETDPVESLLDIYWETTSSGKIKDLNKAILDGGFLGAIATSGYQFNLSEAAAPLTNCFASKVSAINGFGNIIYDNIDFTLVGVTDGSGVNVTSKFQIYKITPGIPSPTTPIGFNIKTKAGEYFYVGQDDEPITFTFVVSCENTDGGNTYNGTIVLNDDCQIDNVAPNFYINNSCGSNLLSQNYPNRIITLPNINEPKNGDVKVWTFYAQNGSNCSGGLQKEEVIFTLKEDGVEYVQGEGKYFIVPKVGDQEGNQDWSSNPGACQVYCRNGAEPTALSPLSTLLITAKDANGTRDTENTFTLEQTVTEYIGPQALINSLNPVCIVGPYDTGTNQYELITLRYEVVWSNLIIGNTINVTYSSSLSNQGATWSNPGDPCGVPGMPAGGGNVSNGSFVATAATQSYYIDIRFEFIYNFPPYGGYYSKENIEIASYDATDNYTGNTLTTTFTGNEALYSVVENLEQTPCPCIPTP
jgi:hypothetical protein